MAIRSNRVLVDEYLKQYQGVLEEANRGFASEGNEINRSLLSQLFVAAGGFISLATALLITKETLQVFTLSHHAKYVLVVVIVSSLASIFCGIAQYRKDAKFLQKRRSLNTQVIDDISSRTIRTIPQLVQAVTTINNQLHPRSRSTWVKAQFGCLSLSGAGLAALVYYLLFIAKINFNT